MKKIIYALLLIITTLSCPVFAFMYGNDSETAYNTNNSDMKSTSSTIRQYVISGAGGYLGSNSDYLEFLNKVELYTVNDTDFSGMQNNLNNAIENLKNAVDEYNQLISKVNKTPYNLEVQEKLVNFDYAGYNHSNGIENLMVFEITQHLQKGEVTEVYILLKADMTDILNSLYLLSERIEQDTLPAVSTMYEINVKYSNSMNRGQFFAEVFSEL